MASGMHDFSEVFWCPLIYCYNAVNDLLLGAALNKNSAIIKVPSNDMQV